MSPRPRLEQAELDTLLDATVRVIARRGVERARLVDVAAEAGCSTGTLQHYYGSREALITAAFHRVNALSGSAAEQIAARHAEPWDALRALVRLALGADDAAGREEWGIWLEFWAACARDPRLRDEVGAVYGIWRAPIRTTIEDGVAGGRFVLATDVDAVVTALLAAIDGVALHVLLGIGGLTAKAAEEVVVRLAADYLGVER